MEIFQSGMIDEFVEFLNSVMLIYIDNFIIHTKTVEEHLDALDRILAVCRKANLHLRLEKCNFMVTELRTLGFLVSHGKIRPDPNKIQMLKSAPVPENRKQLRGYLGLLQFYRDMIPYLSHAAHPLYKATSDKVPFVWNEKLQTAYEATKALLERDIMQTTFEGLDNIVVYTDASKFAICCVITQNGRIVIALSKVLNPTQRKWAIIEKELFAISWACKKLRVFLHGVNSKFEQT